ncbi:hypothetical protein BD309DRAFT_334143 [Dichomitus squalens]|nr:hypothetical protein BD309DRAFT_334143 [Dichomitus squalens]
MAFRRTVRQAILQRFVGRESSWIRVGTLTTPRFYGLIPGQILESVRPTGVCDIGISTTICLVTALGPAEQIYSVNQDTPHSIPGLRARAISRLPGETAGL